jgi:hypothetical protein
MKYWLLFKEAFFTASHKPGGWHWYAAKIKALLRT